MSEESTAPDLVEFAHRQLEAANANGMVTRVTLYIDIDEAREAAGRLAEERG